MKITCFAMNFVPSPGSSFQCIECVRMEYWIYLKFDIGGAEKARKGLHTATFKGARNALHNKRFIVY